MNTSTLFKHTCACHHCIMCMALLLHVQEASKAAPAAAEVPEVTSKQRVTARTYNQQSPAGAYSLDLNNLADRLLLASLLQSHQDGTTEGIHMAQVKYNGAEVPATKLPDLLRSAHGGSSKLSASGAISSSTLKHSTTRASSAGASRQFGRVKECKVEMIVTGMPNVSVQRPVQIAPALVSAVLEQLSGERTPSSWKVLGALVQNCMLCTNVVDSSMLPSMSMWPKA